MIDVKSSICFWELKAIAIFSVFLAHLEWAGDAIGYTIYKSIGCWGVPLFMLMAGFFDAKSKTPKLKRLQKLFIPLLIWGTITFFIERLYHPVDNFFLDYIKWIYGCGTWYYFIPVLFWCQFLVRRVNMWVLTILGIASMLLTYYDVIPYNGILTPYSNPFNLIIYFIIGREYRLCRGENIPYSITAFFISLIVVLVFTIIFQIPLYWNVVTPVFTLSLFYIIWTFLTHLPQINSIIKIGKVSMVLYLCHLQIAQSIANHFCDLLGGGFWGMY